jgi:hypothetical protein
MPFDKTKSTAQQMLIVTQQKLDKIIKIRSEKEGLNLTRPSLMELLATQELKRLEE